MIDFFISFDNAVMLFVMNNLKNPFLDTFFKFITFLGDFGLIWVLTAIIFLFIKRLRPFGLTIIFMIILGYLFNDIIFKLLFHRIRPFISDPTISLIIKAPNGYSLPSGHAFSSFTCATIIFFADKKLGIAALILAALIAFSRVYLLVHYATDVIVGTAEGIIFGIVACVALNYLKKKNLIK